MTRTRNVRALPLSLLAVVAFLVIANPVTAQPYTVTDLGTLGGSTFAYGLNNAGDVTGQSRPCFACVGHAFVYRRGVMTDLFPDSIVESVAWAINDAGQITGRDPSGHAFLDSDGVKTDLGTLDSPCCSSDGSSGRAINGTGQVAGYALIADGATYHAFLYDGGMHDLASSLSEGFGINASGHVTGWLAADGSSPAHVFVHADGVMHDLGDLYGYGGAGLAINDAGDVTGTVGTVTGWGHPIVYTGGVMTDLGCLSGSPGGTGFAINNHGDAVGFCVRIFDPTLGISIDHAWLYSGGVMIDLNAFAPPGVTFMEARGINDHGQIIVNGRASTVDGPQSRAYLLTPVVTLTAPVLSLPATITVDATSPAGAVVTYTASATDQNGPVAIDCTPSSSSTLAIGSTTVGCSATNAAGTTTGSFAVVVRGATTQMTDLVSTVNGFDLPAGTTNSLDVKIAAASNGLTGATAGGATSACHQLSAFIAEAAAQAGKKLTVDQARELTNDAKRIEAVIGCM